MNYCKTVMYNCMVLVIVLINEHFNKMVFSIFLIYLTSSRVKLTASQ